MDRLWISVDRGGMEADNAYSAVRLYSSHHVNKGVLTMSDRASREELIRALDEEEGADEGLEGFDENDLGPDMSEAERLAAQAEGPGMRADGKPKGSGQWKRPRPLTPSQMDYARGLIEGKTMRQAYRDAYPDCKANDASVQSAAFKLSRDPRVQTMVRAAWEQTQEVLAEDRAAAQRWVMLRLVGLSKDADSDANRLRALEMLGRASGLFKAEQPREQPLTAEQLKRELGQHLRLVQDKVRTG